MSRPYNYWTIEKIVEQSIKYNSRQEFKIGCWAAYQKARRKGILDEVCAHMKPKNTLRNCILSAAKYSSYNEWYTEDHASYKQARRKEWSKMCKMVISSK